MSGGTQGTQGDLAQMEGKQQSWSTALRSTCCRGAEPGKVSDAEHYPQVPGVQGSPPAQLPQSEKSFDVKPFGDGVRRSSNASGGNITLHSCP